MITSRTSSYCAECGEELELGSSFCPECGAEDAPDGAEAASTSTQSKPTNEAASSAADQPSEDGRTLRSRTAERLAGVPRRAWLIAGGGVVAMLLIAGGAVWFMKQQDDSQRATTSLSAIARANALLTVQQAKLHRIADIRVLANRIDELLPSLAEGRTAANGISDTGTRDRIVPAANAMWAAATALSRTRTLSAKSLGEWRSHSKTLVSAAAQLRTSWPELVTQADAEQMAKFPPTEELTAVVSRGNQVVTRAAAKLTAWKITRGRAKEAKRVALSQLTTYAAAMRGQISSYQGLRSSTEEFMNQANEGGYGITFNDAYSFITGAQDDRGNIQSSMRGMTPPTDALSAHSGMVNAIGTAVDALNYAYSGLQEWQADKGSYNQAYTSFMDTPSWQQFVSMSGTVTSTWGSAVSGWEAGIAAARAKITKRPLPKQPKV